MTGTFSYFVVYAPPRITVPDDKTFAQGETIAAFDIEVDADPDYRTVEVTGLPAGLSYAVEQVQGTVSADAEVKDYTVTISADGDGEGGTLDYPPTTATFTITVTEPVTVAIAGPAEAQEGAFDVAITFSESVTGFAQGDVTVGNGSVTALSGSGASYTATIEPAASGTVTVDVPADAAASAAGKGNEAASQLSVEVFLPRSIRFEGPTTVRTTEDPFDVRVIFSEVPASGSFSLTRWHCQLSQTWYSGQPTVNYALTPGYTRTRGGTWPYTAKVQVEWRDPREGHPPLVATYQVSVDPDPPLLRKRLGITGPTAPQSGPFDIRLQVSEGGLVGFTKEDITVVNGSVTSFEADSDYGRYYTVQITPAATGAVSVSVGAATFKDLAGWDNKASQVYTVQADLEAPTVDITGPADGHDGAFDATITFSEDVAGFEQGDVTVGNGSVTAFSGSGSSYTATIAPAASDETVTVDVAANAATDAAGNGNEAASQYPVQAHSHGESTVVDLVAPTVTITGPTDTEGLPFEVAIDFSEDVTGFEQGDVTVGNGSVTKFSGSGASYTATILPTTSDGTVTVDVAADAAADDAGNGNEAAPRFSVTVSTTTTLPGRVNDGAAAAISGPTDMQASAFEVTITFTADGQGIVTLPEEAPVTGFEQEDLTVGNGEVTAFSGSGASYRATIRPAGSGPVRVDVPAGVALDGNGRGNQAARQYSVQADVDAPTVTIGGPADDQSGAFDVTIAFSEDVTGFDRQDVAVGNGLVTAFSGSGARYTAGITPTASGTVTVDVAAKAATDGAGNGNEAASRYSVPADLDAPTVAISGPTETQTGPFDVAITFSEDVTGFEKDDVTVGNGSVTAFSGSEARYQATIQPAANGVVTVDVAAKAAADGAGNGNEAASRYSAQADLEAPTVTISGPTDVQTGPFDVAITFSEDVTGFEKDDVTVGNGSVTAFSGSGAGYQVEIWPDASGTVTADVAADAAMDGAGNRNEAASRYSVQASLDESNPVGSRSVAENREPGEPVGAPLSATDPDGDALTYSLSGPHAISFAVDASTGQVQTLAVLDYERRSRYAVQVEVSDGRGGRSSLPVAIDVIDVEEPPLAPDAPVVTSASASSLTVTWSAPLNAGRPALTAYEVQYRATGAGRFIEAGFDGLGTTADLAGLDPDTDYEVQVRARNDEGTGPWSPPGSGRTQINSGPIFGPIVVNPPGRSTPPDLAPRVERWVAENTAAGEPVGAPLSATDPDGDALIYALAGPDAASFAVDSGSGQVRTRAGLDHETRPQYSVQVEVSDGRGGRASQPVTIIVTDVAEPPLAPDAPVLTPASSSSLTATWTAPENEGRPPLTAYEVQYRATGAGRFTEAGFDGLGTTIDLAGLSPDTDYEVQVRARNDEGTGPWSATGSGRTRINNGPVFGADRSNGAHSPGDLSGSSGPYQVERRVPENTAAGEPVGAPVSATDPDGDALTYALAGPDAASFAVDAGSGQVRTRTPLDHETRSRYSVRVEVSDGLGGRASQAVTIVVADVAEPPLTPDAPTVTAATLSSLTATWTAPENSGRPALTSYDVQYRAAGAGRFTEAGFDGLGTTVELNGLAEDTAYEVQVRARNHEGTGPWSPLGSGRTQNNRRPVFDALGRTNNSPAFGADTPGTSDPSFQVERVVAENTTAGEPVGAPLSATDPDGDALTYALAGPDADAFAVDATSGQVRTRAALDHETRSRYAVQVEVSDGRGGTSSLPVAIDVTDVEEPPLAPDSPVVTSATLSSLTVTWTAPENAGRPALAAYEVQYRAAGQGPFTEAGFDGLGTTVELSGLAAGTAYEVQVRALNDEGTGPWSTPGSGRTRINNGPAFGADMPGGTNGPGGPGGLSGSSGLSSRIERRVAENTAAGEPVGAPLAATDPDGDELTYALAGPDAGAFAVDAGRGQVRTRAALDHETRSRYAVQVEVSDGRGGRASQAVTIIVTDVAEPPLAPGAPEVAASTLSSLTVTWTAPENAGRPALAAYEVQYRAAGEISFTEAGFDGLGTTAELGGLDADTAYEVRVRARNDEGTGPWSAPTSGRTRINNGPVFGAGPSGGVGPRGELSASSGPFFQIERRVAENTAGGEPVGAPLAATDPDGDELTYALAGPDAGAFAVDAGSGQVRTRAGLDHETRSRYAVRIEVSDGRGGRASQPVTIVVTDVVEPPLAPDAPAVTAATLSSLTVTWTAPENAGRPALAAYEVQYRAAGEERFTDAGFDGLGTTVDLAGLDSDTAYEVQVRALNDEGTGPWSATGAGTTLASGDASLGLLEVSPGVLSPAFDPGRTEYTLSLDNSVRGFTVKPTTSHGGAALVYGYLAAGEAVSSPEPGPSGEARSFELAAGANRLTITVTAQDDTTAKDYTVVVTRQENQPPRAPAMGDLQTTAGESFSFQVPAFTDPDAELTGQSLGYGAALADGSALPEWLTFADSTRTFRGTPPGAAVLEIEVDATDDGTPPRSAAASFTLTVNQAAPVAVDDEVTVAEGDTAIVEVLANDSDFEGDPLKVELVEGPAHGTAATNDDGTVTYAHDGSETTRDQFRYRLNDGRADSEAATVTIVLSAVNDAPAFEASGYAFELEENRDGSGEPVALGQVRASDPEGEAVTYTLTDGDPARFAVDPTGGAITYRGRGEDAEATDSYLLAVTAADSRGGSASVAVTIRIGDIDEPGAVTLSSYAPLVGHRVTATFADPDAVTDVRWQWHSSEDGVVWEEIPGASSDHYLPASSNLGQLLCVSVTYLNPTGAGKALGPSESLEVEVMSEATQGVSIDPADRARTFQFVLAAVGRQVAQNAIDAVGDRAAAGGRSHATLGGQRLEMGEGNAAQAAAGALGRFLAAHTQGLQRSSTLDPRLVHGSAGGPGSRLPSMHRLVSSSSFQLALGEGGPAPTDAWTLWGRGDAGRFDGQPHGSFTMDGEVYSTYLGIDYRWPGESLPLAGLVFSHNRSEVGHHSSLSGDGEMKIGLTSLHPYGRWSPRSGLDLWTLLGYGRGRSELVYDRRIDMARNLQMWLAALGARQELLSRNGFDLDARTDLFVTKLTPEAVPEMPDTRASSRARLALEARRSWAVTPEAMLQPVLELGARWDDGDAESGPGAELAGGLSYADTRHRLRVEARGHRLLVHRDSFEEWGASLTLRLASGGDRGLNVALAPAWGTASTTNRVDALWRGESPATPGGSGDPEDSWTPDRLNLACSYGLQYSAGLLLTPFGELGMQRAGSGRLRLGTRLVEEAGPQTGGWRLELFGEQQARPGRSSERRLGLQATLSH